MAEPTPLEDQAADRHRFGTFGGVFTPSILTILGVIMFIRSGFVIGESGIFGAIVILCICKLITLMTALSIAAVSTNMQVRGGGAYFMISRVLGPEFGGAIGVALFFAQALSVPFYVLGFTEALVLTFPEVTDQFRNIALVSATVLFGIAYIGASWAIRAQYIIMAILVLSMIAFFGGAIALFDTATFQENLVSGYTLNERGQPYTFWAILAIYFPAVTGILAGVNMSGDLENPARSIPRGTFAAIIVGFVIYLLQMVITGGAFSRDVLINQPFESLRDNAMFGAGFLVVAGMFAAALSSALGSYLGAPRILQAVARDRILEIVRPFAKGSAKGDEPKRGLVLTGVITFIVIVLSGNDSGGGALNTVASIITMFFLYTYGMVNVAAFVEAFVGNPSFRPRFQMFHWTTALLGGIGCIGVAVLINPIAAVIAILMLGGLLWHLKTRELQATFGDARRGFVFTSLRSNMLRLTNMEEDTKNWRPSVLVFSGDPVQREGLVTYGVWLESGRGVVVLANVLVGDAIEMQPQRAQAIEELTQFCREKNIFAFPSVLVAENRYKGITALLQTSAMGPVRPNIALFGWVRRAERMEAIARYYRMSSRMGISIVSLYMRETPRINARRRIDVWWRGHKNGHLMVILAHLLRLNWEWNRATIRVLRLTPKEADLQTDITELEELLEEARVDGEVKVIASERPFREVLHQHSKSSDCVFMGFEIPKFNQEDTWYENYHKLLKGMPTTILVSSQGQFDLRA